MRGQACYECLTFVVFFSIGEFIMLRVSYYEYVGCNGSAKLHAYNE